jgi:hypothetical protein
MPGPGVGAGVAWCGSRSPALLVPGAHIHPPGGLVRSKGTSVRGAARVWVVCRAAAVPWYAQRRGKVVVEEGKGGEAKHVERVAGDSQDSGRQGAGELGDALTSWWWGDNLAVAGERWWEGCPHPETCAASHPPS